jgi:hypothetical protein
MQQGFFWASWAQALKRRGLNEPAAVFLETLGPLSVILAQAVTIGQPFLNGLLPDEQIKSLVKMLEDQQQRTTFVALLEEDID